FSPTSVTPASARAGRSSASTYLVAASTSTAGPTCSRTRARFWRITSASSKPPHHPLTTGAAAVAAMREVATAPADRALLRPVDLAHARRLQRAPRTQPQVGITLPPAH